MAPSQQEQDENDQRAKRAARRSRNGVATQMVDSASPTTFTSGSSQGLPGAVAVSAESEAARIDQRIANRKQDRLHHGGNSINTSRSTSGTASKSYAGSTEQIQAAARDGYEATTAPELLIQQPTSQLERDVSAKQQAQQRRRVQPSRPGAFAVSEDASSASVRSSKSETHVERGNLEDLVSSKTRGAGRGRAASTFTSGGAKTASSVALSLAPSTTPHAHAEHKRKKANMLRKTGAVVKATNTTGHYNDGGYTVASAPLTEQENLEERIARKTAGIDRRYVDQHHGDPHHDGTPKGTDPVDGERGENKKEQRVYHAPPNKIALDKGPGEEGSGVITSATEDSMCSGPDQNGQVPNPDVEYGVYNQTAARHSNEDLAVAVPVNEETEDVFIPSAVEFDPDAKPQLRSSKRFRHYIILAIFVLVAIIIGVAVGIPMTRKSVLGEQTPTAAPTTTREGLGIRATVQNVVGEEALTNENSPYARALEWITNEDPMMLSPTAPNFVQRYLMAYFYFATTVDGPWRSCNPPNYEEGEGSHCYFQMIVSVSPEAFEPVNSTRWLSNTDECTWAGTDCDNDEELRGYKALGEIDLQGQSLSGPFPEGVKHFPYLQNLALTRSDLRGPLPTSLNEMKRLLSIELNHNNFTGEIPSQWWEARKLLRINLGDNSLVGTISSAIGQLQDLKGLYLGDNQFSGELPKEIGDLDSLSFFRIGRNSLEGSLPTELAKLTQLEEIWLHRNKFSGSIPSELGNLKSIGDFRVHYNELSGSIPEEFWNMSDSTSTLGPSNLFRLDLYDNQLIGTLSSNVGKMLGLYTLRLKNNQFTGQIPPALGLMTDLEEVALQGNSFAGEIPSELCALRGGEFYLEALEADCAAPPSFGAVPKVTCPNDCCTLCCPGSFCEDQS